METKPTRKSEIEALFAGGAHGARDLCWVYAVGSRVTCSPPPTDTDEDWLAYVMNVDADAMAAAGFKQDGSPEFYTGNDNGGFVSWRRGDLNIITTESSEFFWRFVTATDLAKRFNLLAKADRIALFQAVLYGVHSQNLEQKSNNSLALTDTSCNKPTGEAVTEKDLPY